MSGPIASPLTEVSVNPNVRARLAEALGDRWNLVCLDCHGDELRVGPWSAVLEWAARHDIGSELHANGGY